MKIGIIGSGNIGGTLARIWAGKNHEIMLGLRNPQDKKYQDFAGVKNIKLATVKEAAEFGNVILMSVPYNAAKNVIKAMGNISGKVLIDTSNALNVKMDGLLIGHKTSAAEEIAKMAKGARVVKAFNNLGYQNLTNLDFKGTKADAFICGDDAAAKEIVAGLAKDCGFDVVDAGGLKQARLIEPLAMLWISMAYGLKMGTGIAFKLLKK
jgi:NADPH-dependent F420 reductase